MTSESRLVLDSATSLLSSDRRVLKLRRIYSCDASRDAAPDSAWGAGTAAGQDPTLPARWPEPESFYRNHNLTLMLGPTASHVIDALRYIRTRTKKIKLVKKRGTESEVLTNLFTVRQR